MMESAEQLMVEDLYNRVRDMMDDRSPYNTPCVLDLQRAMVQDRLEAPTNAVDEVWPNVFIAEKSVAVNKARLKRMGVTHILNAAHGTGVYTGETFYAGMGISYMGIEVDDFPHADISPHFRTTAEFLDEALLTHKGKVLVVSMMGASRSAVLVASYLMIFHHMSILEALTALRAKRPINPNEGFLKQLRELNEALMEERDDDDETLSQCSVIDARARARIFGDAVPDENGEGEEDTDEEGEEEEGRSMVGARARSIMMEEEEDGASVVSSAASSLASSASAALLRSGPHPRSAAEGPEGFMLPEGFVLPDGGGGEDDDDDDDGVSNMVREWQQRNAKYQSDDWWEAALNCDDSDLDSLSGGPGAADADLESVALSEDVRAVKARLLRRPKRPPSGAASTISSCTSYSDLWKQRLREIEEQAAARYRKRDEEESSEGTATDAGDDVTAGGGGGGGGGGEGGGGRRKKKLDDDVHSLMSDTSSMFNFCQRNKEKLTPLERWRVKRIQFGWNKKEGEDGDRSSVSGSGSGVGGGEDGEGEARAPALEDVNLAAYHTWKLKQQRRYGEEDKDEIVEMSRGGAGDSAAAKRRQRREEILERSRKNLEESQSMCGWEAESSVGGGGTVPLSAFWTTGPQSVANDDAVSMVSGRSSVISSVSQSRGARVAPPSSLGGGVPMVPPILPVPTVPGPGGEPMVNLASIQNWIANVVSETILQRQGEMSLPPPSRAGSSVGSTPSVLSGFPWVPGGRGGTDEDKASLLSGASSYAAKNPPVGGGGASSGRADSVFSVGGGASGRVAVGSGSVAGLGSVAGSSVASKRSKITTTSVPLYSLFQDQVDLKKLDSMDREMKTEMRGRMATYERKKILEDNKKSTLYKKKKPKEDEEEEDEEERRRRRREEEFLAEEKRKKEKPPARSYGQSGCLNLNTALERGKNTSVDEWLESVRPPPRKTTAATAAEEEEEEADPYDDLDASASEFGFARGSDAEEEEEEGRRGYRSRAEPRGTQLGGGAAERLGLRTGRAELTGSWAAGRSYGGSDGVDSGSARYPHSAAAGGGAGDEDDDDVAAFIAATRQRARARAAAEVIDDEVLEAWRAQQGARESQS